MRDQVSAIYEHPVTAASTALVSRPRDQETTGSGDENARSQGY